MPRRCGIATFTSDLANALSDLNSSLTVDAIAMNDGKTYEYPDRVRYEIDDQIPDSYRQSANYLNVYGYDVLSVQHEYGIFGGVAGQYLMNLVREAKMPIVTTLHTVLDNPSPEQRAVLDELMQLSERVIVMSKKAVGFLNEVHDVPASKIDLIHHGIPDFDRISGVEFRKSLNVQGPMILTFGLLSPDKGIQYTIRAMPQIVAAHPEAVYFIVGATHPHVLASAGETYRQSLIQIAEKLGVSKNIRFVDRFVDLDELVGYLGAMDVYITPYLNPKQITSGTLAYSLGAGKAVISTPYWYAEELLAEDRGLLVPFRNSDSIALSVLELQSNANLRKQIGETAGAFGQQMLWPAVARRYLTSFERDKRDSADRLRSIVQPEESIRQPRLPDVRLDHLLAMSDDTGILQHATFTTPNRSEGYCVDDNARALLLTALLEEHGNLRPDLAILQSRYLSFVLDAFNPINGRFRNFLSYQREWLEKIGSEDSHGRSIWCVATMARLTRDSSRRDVSKSLFYAAIPALQHTSSLRTWTYAVLAASEFLRAFPDDQEAHKLIQTMASRIWRQYEICQTDEWPWFEVSLTYANARVPQALILAGESLDDPAMVSLGINSLKWLMSIQTGPHGEFAPIGSDGFYERNGKRNHFDQQPIEAWASVSACVRAYQVTLAPSWLREAERTFSWFTGANMLGSSVCDPNTGGCHDGLHEDRINRNQGAESTLSYLCALLELKSVVNMSRKSALPNAHEIK